LQEADVLASRQSLTISLISKYFDDQIPFELEFISRGVPFRQSAGSAASAEIVLPNRTGTIPIESESN